MTDDVLIVGQKHMLPFDDGGEKLAVSFDKSARHFNDVVTIRANESDNSEIYVAFADVAWLAATLAELDEVIKTGRARTQQ